MTDPDTFLAERQRYSDARLESFRQTLESEIPSHERPELIGDHTCIYAVGSGGRRELSPHSDLDIFLVKHGEPRRIDEVRLQSAVLRALRAQHFDDPSDDANFLKLHSALTLIERLGEPRDDSENTFTVRMLLLLESRPLVGVTAHADLAKKSLDAYWKNTEAHSTDYLPIIFLNDIVRYWRILLLNYESKSAEKQRRLDARRAELSAAELERAQLELEADHWFRSYKLRFSRCLMCYSSISYLLAEALATQAESQRANVTRAVVDEMIQRTPVERLEGAIARARNVERVAEIGAELKSLYAQFLRDSDRSKSELHTLFSSRKDRRPLFRAAKNFGEKMFDFIEALGRNNPLFRYLVV
jgi:hypothetical protein